MTTSDLEYSRDAGGGIDATRSEGSTIAAPCSAPPGIIDRLWQPGDNFTSRPVPDPAMFYGPLGDYALQAAEHSEASPAAIYFHALAWWAAVIGRKPHFVVGDAPHSAALFMLCVGDTAKGRKGTANNVARRPFEQLDERFTRLRVMSGFGSGEALIGKLDQAEANDAAESAPAYDNRLLVLEPEFAALIKRGNREGSTTIQMLRNGWDGTPLEHHTVRSDRRVANYHLCVIGHITRDELVRRLRDSDISGGFANRFLYCWTEAHKVLPAGGNVPDAVVANAVAALRPALGAARHRGRMALDDEANDLWSDIYHQMWDDDPGGVLSDVITRDAPQTLRIALGLAVADGASVVTADHLGAAYRMWLYSRDTAAHVFGERLVDGRADKVLTFLRECGPIGATLEELTGGPFGNHGKADDRRSLLDQLEGRGLIAHAVENTNGRRRTRYWATNPNADHSSLTSQLRTTQEEAA